MGHTQPRGLVLGWQSPTPPSAGQSHFKAMSSAHLLSSLSKASRGELTGSSQRRHSGLPAPQVQSAFWESIGCQRIPSSPFTAHGRGPGTQSPGSRSFCALCPSQLWYTPNTMGKHPTKQKGEWLTKNALFQGKLLRKGRFRRTKLLGPQSPKSWCLILLFLFPW